MYGFIRDGTQVVEYSTSPNNRLQGTVVAFIYGPYIGQTHFGAHSAGPVAT